MTDRVLGILGGGLVDPQTPLLRADDLGVMRGDGCFEAMRVRNTETREIDGIDGHLARLTRSAARLDLPEPDLAAWRALIDELLDAWAEPGEAVLRLFYTRGLDGDPEARPTGFGFLHPVPDDTLRYRRDGIRVVTLDRGMPSDVSAAAPWLLGGAKTLSYAVNMAAVREAKRRDADDALFVSTDGRLLEGPTANVVWLRDGVLHTPPADELGILAGITVRTLFAAAGRHGFGTATVHGTPADLLAAEGVWMVSSVRLAAPVRTLDGTPLPVDPDTTSRVQTAAGR